MRSGVVRIGCTDRDTGRIATAALLDRTNCYSGGYTTLGFLKPPTQYPCRRTEFTAAGVEDLS